MRPMRRLIWLPAALLAASCSIGTGPTIHDKHTIELDKSELTRLNLRIGAGELRVSGGAAKKVEADLAYNSDRLKPTVEQRASGSRSEIEISQPESRGFTFGNTVSEWDVRLHNEAPLELAAKLGAGEAHLDLAGINLRGLNVDIGVGEVSVDLRSTPKSSYAVNINGGVGEARIMLPKTVGISANAKGGIGEIHVDGLEKKGDRWINPGHENDAVQITVDAKGGVGEIRISAQ
jgi:N-terminal domain of toast_rack, DUF2154